jgi:hypothetical protein
LPASGDPSLAELATTIADAATVDGGADANLPASGDPSLAELATTIADAATVDGGADANLPASGDPSLADATGAGAASADASAHLEQGEGEVAVTWSAPVDAFPQPPGNAIELDNDKSQEASPVDPLSAKSPSEFEMEIAARAGTIPVNPMYEDTSVAPDVAGTLEPAINDATNEAEANVAA